MEHILAFLIITLSVSVLLLVLLAMGGILCLLEKVFPNFCDKLLDFLCR